VALRPDVVRLHLLAARAAVADDQGLLAGLREVDAALELSPGDPIAQLERVRLLVARAAATRVPAHADAASDEVRRRLARDPNSLELWHQQALLAAVVGDGEGATEAEAHVAALTPETGDA
jgi:hypothetical protein